MTTNARDRLALCAVLAAMTAVRIAAQGPDDLASHYRDAARKIITSTLLGNHAYARLSQLCDGVGNRLSGSANLDRAIEWAVGAFKEAGLENVHTEPVMVPHWERGAESVEMVAPRTLVLPSLALGGSVGTPEGGIEAEALVVKSFAELDARGAAAAKGKIVVFNVPYEGYGKTVQYRATGASRAANLGALAVVVRSAGNGGVRTPHTGALHYDDGIPQIPAAAVSAEDAAMLGRLASSGQPVRLRIKLGCRFLPDAPSANVVGDLVGSEKPEEVVVLGGHLDSWDVGQGAQDDGGGCISTLEAVAMLKHLGLKPRRTIRVVWFTNEENGARGAAGYLEKHRAEVGRHVAAIESDGGIEKLVGFGWQLGGERKGRDSHPAASRPADPVETAAAEKLRSIISLLAGLEATTLKDGGGGVDIGPIMLAGVPGISPTTIGERYFEWHHTEGDTVDKIDPKVLDTHVAALAVVAYVLADMPERLIPVGYQPAGR